jgi:hypothetical protein
VPTVVSATGNACHLRRSLADNAGARRSLRAAEHRTVTKPAYRAATTKIFQEERRYLFPRGILIGHG